MRSCWPKPLLNRANSSTESGEMRDAPKPRAADNGCLTASLVTLLSTRLNFRALFWAACGLAAPFAWGQPAEPTVGSTTRIIVKFKEPRADVRAQGLSASPDVRRMRDEIASRAARTTLRMSHRLRDGAEVYSLGEAVGIERAREIAARMTAEDGVEYAAPDVWVQRQSVSMNDTYFSQQWALSARLLGSQGTAAFSDAWRFAQGSGAVVAVIDTGILQHDDLSTKVINGYDFVSDFSIAGDGNGRDADPSDPGDYCTSRNEDSSWHGLMMSSIAAAVSNNGRGISGALPAGRVLAVRALGRCGGWLSDVADAIAWSAGEAVAGVPGNSTPASVISLSLGSAPGLRCADHGYLQAAVNAAISRGVVVVAAAGNEGVEAVGLPAGCNGVIAVGAHTASGDLAEYSNRSARVTLTAPGGGPCIRQTTSCNTFPIAVLGDAGLRGPTIRRDLDWTGGTSAATPYVAAAAALLKSLNAALTPGEITGLLTGTARTHPADSYCAAMSGRCGAGMVDADAAVNAVISGAPVVTISGPQTAVPGNTDVQLSAEVAFGTAPYTYTWRQVEGPAVTLTGRDARTLSFSTPAAKSQLLFEVNVTDMNLRMTTSQRWLVVSNPPRILGPSELEATKGVALSVQLEAEDPDTGDVISFVRNEGPSGLSVSPSGLLEWSSPRAGEWRIVVEAADESGVTSGPHVITLRVSEGGGGGGAFAYGWLALLGLAVLRARRLQT
ncbi:hypothetical protein C1704_05840 [Caldimonas caldifontis]|uniref:Peptidase S8/S53 domain-containing protein n=2 Tax=Caldimonas caldifontis TaxID=1452508 RepID=A0A2S5SW34_9BURK|nr:hypothetical protein C1704_05840 [Caldimonas caldifontis]